MSESIWLQRTLRLGPQGRGVHLITDEVRAALPELGKVKYGLLHLFLQHTSASLTITENADPTVRQDLESHLNRTVPERSGLYRHDYEGADDMPAHIKSSLLGVELTLPVTDGRLNLGVWQGICLCEHRDLGGERRVLMTLQGQSR